MKYQHPSFSPAPNERVPLLREAVEVLVGVLRILSQRSLGDLPELKKKKVVLAGRLGAVDWSHGSSETETFDLKNLKFLIAELELQTNQQIESHLRLIAHQLLALQDEHQYWRECLNVSFGKYCALPTI